MFEEEYQRAARKPKYQTLFDEVGPGDEPPKACTTATLPWTRGRTPAADGMLKDSRGEGKTQADESAYQLIMRDKEQLLSFESKLKFIFSHSALKEGWDNPNVFQICTLNETRSTMKKRQEIGRGLRMAVNQDGERVHGFDVNRLTVMANESYEDFARQLQTEIEQEEGIRFGVVEKHLFASIPVETDGARTRRTLAPMASETVWHHLHDQGYIDAKGKVQDSACART
ncbi:MAG: hypothetical protein U5L11_00925 [Arhodomonas sp.]|nr:hypothetical protein [Arhodomonas sp.]